MSVEVATRYLPDPTSQVKGKISDAGELTLSYKQALRAGVTLGVGASMNVLKLDEPVSKLGWSLISTLEVCFPPPSFFSCFFFSVICHRRLHSSHTHTSPFFAIPSSQFLNMCIYIHLHYFQVILAIPFLEEKGKGRRGGEEALVLIYVNIRLYIFSEEYIQMLFFTFLLHLISIPNYLHLVSLPSPSPFLFAQCKEVKLRKFPYPAPLTFSFPSPLFFIFLLFFCQSPIEGEGKGKRREELKERRRKERKRV